MKNKTFEIDYKYLYDLIQTIFPFFNKAKLSKYAGYKLLKYRARNSVEILLYS